MNDSFLRRRDAAEYLLEKYGFGAERTLAKGAVTGDTPEYRKAGRIVLYTRDALGAVAICVGIEFGAISSMTRLPDHAARSIV